MLRSVSRRLCASRLQVYVVWCPSHLQPGDPLSRVQSDFHGRLARAEVASQVRWGNPLRSLHQCRFVGAEMSVCKNCFLLVACGKPLIFNKKYREMLWVFSVIHPGFLALILHEFFFTQKRYFFHDIATNWAPLYCCVLWYLNKEGYTTMRRTACRLIRLFAAGIAGPHNTRI